MSAPKPKWHIWRSSREGLRGNPYEWVVQTPTWFRVSGEGRAHRRAYNTFEEARRFVASGGRP